ncbi:LacI family transcriptional regulator [Paraburkholderia aspalathi]|nr:LacI family transcriptional regulator [Paraburkholderia aspalathi]
MTVANVQLALFDLKTRETMYQLQKMAPQTALPQDIAFVGYGDPSFYEWIASDITTIFLPVETLGKRAVDMTISWGEEAEDRFVTLARKADDPTVGVI